MRALFVVALLLLAGCTTTSDPADPTTADSVEGPADGDAGVVAPDEVHTAPDPGRSGDDNGSVMPDRSEGEASNTSAEHPIMDPPAWGDPETAEIYPGVGISTGASSCTTNFLFTSTDNAHIYIGTAAHCFRDADGGGNACEGAIQPIAPGAEVRFLLENATYTNWYVNRTAVNDTMSEVRGTLVYNSEYTLTQVGGEPDDPVCGSNDFALIEVPRNAAGLISPRRASMPSAFYLLPPSDLAIGQEVRSFGNTVYWFGEDALREKIGVVTCDATGAGRGWSAMIAMWAPGIWGDSGSPVWTEDGGAIGVLTSLTGQCMAGGTAGGPPTSGTNVIRFLDPLLAFMHEHTGLDVRLAQP